MPGPQDAYPDLRRSVCVVMLSKQTTWATPQFRRADLAGSLMDHYAGLWRENAIIWIT